ncbi:PTS sugar transporter subunit IIA [Holdemania massiliensis]|uniref:PTS sugar transporter subunit IIA n=1 Tax=Holdemania massiliensis TaxID=1468449 RepID=UPI001F061A54|nr:hypothetical protein [Holdemania massiliensis]MCH1940847.1 hypothetical protein [Holdemania massiliensis]
MNKQIILCSHGRLCEGMLDTLRIFSLDQAMPIRAIPFYTEGVDSEAQLSQLADSITADQQVLIFTDIAYGSVHQQVMLQFGDWDNVTVITGMNLPLVLELAATGQAWTTALIDAKIKAAQKAILCADSLSFTMSEEDE